MMKLIKKIFSVSSTSVNLTEGWYADQYPEDHQQLYIRTTYRKRWQDPNKNPTPLTHPWIFDPCEPPKGWRYDPYYECWIQTE